MGQTVIMLFRPKSISFDEEKFTLLLNVAEAVINFGNTAETAAENGFDKKSEFHITVLGFKAGGVIKQALEKFPEDKKQDILQKIHSLILQMSWGFEFLTERYHIKKEYRFKSANGFKTELRESYIQMLSLPEMDVFYGELNKILGINLNSSPSHITLYTSGDDRERAKMGIGINSKEEFLELRPKSIQ